MVTWAGRKSWPGARTLRSTISSDCQATRSFNLSFMKPPTIPHPPRAQSQAARLCRGPFLPTWRCSHHHASSVRLAWGLRTRSVGFSVGFLSVCVVRDPLLLQAFSRSCLGKSLKTVPFSPIILTQSSSDSMVCKRKGLSSADVVQRKSLPVSFVGTNFETLLGSRWPQPTRNTCLRAKEL